MSFKSLETKRLRIRQLIMDDAKIISSYRSSPAVSEFQSWDSYSVDEATELIREMASSSPTNRGRWFQFGIELIKDKKLIGDIGFLNCNEEGKSWIGFSIDSKHWHCGYASEAVEAILKFYMDLEVSSVWASIDPQNQRSRKLLQRLGFTLVEEKIDDLVFKKDTI